MPDDRSRIRRSDRAMPDDEAIRAFLNKATVGFIATSVDEQPFVLPNLFWYDGATRRIYFHTGRQGRMRHNVEHNPRVCLAAGELGRLLPAKTAIEFSNEYASVCVFGKARVVQEEDEQRYGLQGLLDKYFPQLKPGIDYRTITSDELAITSVYAIEIEEWSGKQNLAKT